MEEIDLQKEMQDAIDKIEDRLKIKRGFLFALLNEDDWSFVIKSHALIEASLTNCLTVFFGDEKLSKIFSRLELSGKYYGKLEFAKELGLLIEHERCFISSISQLRNQLVHNISEVNFSFNNYINKLDANQKSNFINNFGYCYLVKNSEGKSEISKRDLVLSEPKKTIWLSLKLILAIISTLIDTKELNRETIKLKVEQADYQDKILKLLLTNRLIIDSK